MPEKRQLKEGAMPMTAVTTQLAALEKSVKDAQINLAGDKAKALDPVLAKIVSQQNVLGHPDEEGKKLAIDIVRDDLPDLKTLVADASVEGESDSDEFSSIRRELDLYEEVLDHEITNENGAPNPVSSVPSTTKEGEHTLYPENGGERQAQPAPAAAPNAPLGTDQQTQH